MSKLLMVSYKFPPMHNTSCVRTWGFYRHIKQYFDDVLVISTSNRHILRQEPIDMDGVRVFDASTYDYRTAFQADNGQQSVLKDKSKESSWGRFAQKLSASFPTMYLFGEGGVRYINSGYRIGKQLIAEQGVTHIFSSFSPYADHIIAYRLKKKFPYLFWIADFRDLHVDPTQDNMLFRKYQKQYNSEILSLADCVTTVSEGLAKHLEEFNSNVYVLRNGIELPPPEEKAALHQKFAITYTGSMYGDRRDPRPLLTAIRDLLANDGLNETDIEVRYAGKDSDVWRQLMEEYGLTDIFYDEGLISRESAVELQQRSHINLLLTYSSDDLTGNITGKIFEYIRAMRPIFVLINGPRDAELEDIMKDMHGDVYYNDDIDRLRSDLRKAIYLHKKGEDRTTDMREQVQPFLWENTIRGLASHIELTASNEV